MTSQLANAPILLENFRGTDAQDHPLIECVHRGLICVVSGNKDLVYEVGDGTTGVHMRSCAKPFQVLPLLEHDLSDDVQPCDFALFMSSHAGEDLHTSRVKKLLASMKLDEHALRCGACLPQDERTRCKLIRANAHATELHNNCSGKHTAMLMACRKNNFDISTYDHEDHPLQKQIKRYIAHVADIKEDDINSGIDGCSLPTFVIPLRALALMYARFSLWQSSPPAHESFFKEAFKKLFVSACDYPEYVAGTKMFDTALITASSGKIFSKTGADGMHALSIQPCEKYPHGLGVAIKIADGDALHKIRPLIIKEILMQLQLWPADHRLDRFLLDFKNYRGTITGGFLNHFKKHA